MNVMRRPGQGDPSKLMSSGQQRIDDSLQSFVSGLGTWKDPTVQLKFYLKLLNRDEVENAFRGDWIARKIVMAPAEDATREWRAWQANGDQIELIEEEERTHNIQKKTREAIFKARLYGGAGMVIGVDDGKDVIEPLDLDSVKKGDLKFVVVMNRYELAAGPRIYNVNSPWYTYPEYFTVQTPMFGFYGEHGDTYPNSYASGEWTPPPGRVGKDPTGRGDPARQMTPISGMVRIHPSRVVQFVGNELPDWRLVPLGGLWGDSVLQTIDDILKDFGLTIGSIANMVNDAKMDVIKIPNLTAIHLATQEATSALLARFGLANQAKSTVNSLLLDAQEEWERIQTSFGGLPDIMKQFMMLICAGGGVPYSRVFGGQSRGLGEEGSSGAGGGAQDLKGYYDDVSSKQKTVITPAMDPLDQVLLRSALGRFDPNVFYEWSPLYQPDPKEVAAIQLQKAQTTQIYVNLGLINEDVMRTVVINQQIEDGQYPGMEDAVDEYGEEPDEPEGDFDPQSGNVLPGTPTHAAMQQIAPPGGGNAEAQDAAASQRRGYLLGKKSFKQFRQAQIKDDYHAHLQDVWSEAAREASIESREANAKGKQDETPNDPKERWGDEIDLSADERLALKHYQGTASTGGAEVNAVLRSPLTGTKKDPLANNSYQKKLLHEADSINDALSRSKLGSNQTVWRVLGGGFGNHLAKEGDGLVGKDLPALGFQSTSKVQDFETTTTKKAGGFPVVMKISVPKDAHAVDVDHLAGFNKDYQHEVLLGEGHYYVDGFTKTPGTKQAVLNVSYVEGPRRKFSK